MPSQRSLEPRVRRRRTMLALSCGAMLAATGAVAGAQSVPAPTGGDWTAAAPLRRPARIFEELAPLAVTLAADFDRLRGDRGDDPPWRPATIAVGGAPAIPLRARARGNWRRTHCVFPPLRLNFRRDTRRGTPFAGLDEPKLVSPCRDDDRSDRYVLQELMLYRVYALLTPYAFRVRLLRVTYVDAASGRQRAVRWGFLLEEPNALAERARGAPLKLARTAVSDLHPPTAARMGLFQYLVGNTDWTLAGPHNLELIAIGEQAYPVPYDFDFAGAVNAHYATPMEGLPIRDVRNRHFRGFCLPPEAYAEAFAAIAERRGAIAALYADEVGRLLGPDVTRQTLRYFDEFHEAAGDERRRRRIIEGCLRAG